MGAERPNFISALNAIIKLHPAIRKAAHEPDLIEVQAGSLAYGGCISAHLDSPAGPLLAEIEISRTGGWQNWKVFSAPLRARPTGVHALYLVFHGKPGRLFDLLNVKFS